MDNLTIYNKYRAVPPEAQKEIKAGRLKGMTDINPMWRIKCLTEAFGPCGMGWVAPIKEKWLQDGANGEIVANVIIGLRYKTPDGEWSEEVEGIGGSSFVANERNGLYTSDEAYKMAYTDAISVACKALGFGADVYWQKGRTKYSASEPETIEGRDAEEWLNNRRVQTVDAALSPAVCACCGAEIAPYMGANGKMVDVRKHIAKSKELFGRVLCLRCIEGQPNGNAAN